MLVRFGYVAMSVHVPNASPSRTMTYATFRKLADREAAVRKLERIAEENLRNTLRLLWHNKAHDIRVYRFSSRLVPLLGHGALEGWDPFPALAEAFAAIGAAVRDNAMRVSFHPEHFTVLGTPKPDVLRSSVADLDRHVRMLECMGLGEEAKCNIHIGGTYGDKEKTLERFLERFSRLGERVARRMTLENDDKTYNAGETLTACERLGVPFVADIHHDAVNPGEDALPDLWERVLGTWRRETIPPKIHVSSPKSPEEPRGHADYVDAESVLAFLRAIAPSTDRLDVMIEAKKKDDALFRLMRELREARGVRVVDQATVEISS